MSDYVIESISLSKCFGRKTALRNLTLRLPRGGVHALVGRNGAGKTTLFRILLGLLHPSSGTSRVLGFNSGALSPEARGRIGFVGEEHTLPGWMRVAALAEMHRHLYPRFCEKTFRDVLEPFEVSERQKVSALSRGERAGLCLALALAQRPELLILDEPTLGLDVVAQHAFMEAVLFRGEKTSSTIVYCSHQIAEIERVADHLVVLERGELLAMSSPDELQSRIRGWLVEVWPGSVAVSEVPGLLQWRALDGMQQLIVIDQGEDFSEVLEDLGAQGVQSMPIGFDRAIGALLARHRTAEPG